MPIDFNYLYINWPAFYENISLCGVVLQRERPFTDQYVILAQSLSEFLFHRRRDNIFWLKFYHNEHDMWGSHECNVKLTRDEQTKKEMLITTGVQNYIFFSLQECFWVNFILFEDVESKHNFHSSSSIIYGGFFCAK